MNRWMNGWMDERLNEWMDGLMDGWMNERTNELTFNNTPALKIHWVSVYKFNQHLENYMAIDTHVVRLTEHLKAVSQEY